MYKCAALAVLLSKGCTKVQSGEDSREVLQTLVCRFKSREARSVGAFRSCCHVVQENLNCSKGRSSVIMHLVAPIQPSLDLSTRLSTVPARMPSDKKEGQQRRESESREGRVTASRRERWRERRYRGFEGWLMLPQLNPSPCQLLFQGLGNRHQTTGTVSTPGKLKFSNS